MNLTKKIRFIENIINVGNSAKKEKRRNKFDKDLAIYKLEQIKKNYITIINVLNHINNLYYYINNGSFSLK
jgi:hypothetical protein